MDERLGELERLYRAVGPGLLAFLRRRCAAEDEAEDLLQETFVEAARHGSRLDGAYSKRAWLYAVARNLAAAGARRRGILSWQPLPDDTPQPPGEREDPMLAALRGAIAELPVAQREILELRLVSELSYAEIAETLKIPIGTVRSRIHAVVELLRSTAKAALIAQES